MNNFSERKPQTSFDRFFQSERSPLVEQQYVYILAMLADAVTKLDNPVAAQLLIETAQAIRRIAAGMPHDKERLFCDEAALYRLTYVSFAVERDSGRLFEQAEAIARVSAERNLRDSVTGALSVGAGWFAQIIEGPSRALLQTFDRVLCDQRHEDVRVLDFVPIESREFGCWSMAFSGEIAPELVRQAVADYVAQELLAQNCAAKSGLALAMAMSARLAPSAAAAAAE